MTPCNSDYMEPSRNEILMSRVACLIDESNGIPINKNYWEGYHPRVYNQTYDKYADESTYEENNGRIANFKGKRKKLTLESLIIELLQKLDIENISQYSLEMQIWWRDYKREQLIKETDKKKKKEISKKRKTALAKLTEEEKEILGID